MALRNQLVACVIRQYGTGLYRAWVSLDKNQTVCLGAHQDEANATELINRFLETYQEGRIKTLEDVLAFINSFCVKDRTTPLPVIDQAVGELAA
ncbi:MAG TPA: hypothetical protein VJ810_20445 [Blastocatellia bacterium]|nr:hypothetical protein [Blastocatellia bacterium]